MGDDKSFFDELNSKKFTRRDVLKGAAAAGAGPGCHICGG